MSLRKTLVTIAIVWLVFITLLHAAINLHFFDSKRTAAAGQNKFRIGFLPVTCHLTCPVTDFINKQIAGESIFQPLRFNGSWTESPKAANGSIRVWITGWMRHSLSEALVLQLLG